MEFSSSDQFEVLQLSATCLSVHYFERFLAGTKPRRPEAEQSPVILTRTILPGSHLKACRLLVIVPIERRNLRRRQSVNLYWTSL